MTKRINFLQIAIGIYLVAIVMYSFMNNHSIGWSLYRDSYITLLVVILAWFGFKKQKTEMDKALIIGLVLQRLFCLACFALWYIKGADWWDTPLIYSTIVVVCLFLGIIINRRSWK